MESFGCKRKIFGLNVCLLYLVVVRGGYVDIYLYVLNIIMWFCNTTNALSMVMVAM